MKKIHTFVVVLGVAFASLLTTACNKGGDQSNSYPETSSTETAAEKTTEAPAPVIATGPKPTPETMKMAPPFTIADSSKIVTTPSGLKYYIVHIGEGNVPQTNQTITAHYHGMLTDGKKFDSSYDRKQTFETPIGVGRVIKGWDEAFSIFPVGTKAVLIVPPDLGYGPVGAGENIPGNATLVFHVELLGVK